MIRALPIFFLLGVVFGFAPWKLNRPQNRAHLIDSPSRAFGDGVDMLGGRRTSITANAASILNEFPGYFGEVTRAQRDRMNEIILKLENLNPTVDPAKSTLMNGVWELRYAAGYTTDGAVDSPTRQVALFLYSGGYSPGLFALTLAQKLPSALIEVLGVEISISREQPRIVAKVELQSILGKSAVEVKARLNTESDLRLRETYESATVMGRPLEMPTTLQYSRDIYVTYVDDELLIIRDGSGIPEVLVRKRQNSS